MGAGERDGFARGIEIPGFESWTPVDENYARAFSSEVHKRFRINEDFSEFRKTSDRDTIHLVSQDRTMGLVIAGRLIATPNYLKNYDEQMASYESRGAIIDPENTFIDDRSQQAGFMWYAPEPEGGSL